MSKPNESNSRLYDINYYCFPFFVNKKEIVSVSINKTRMVINTQQEK